MYINTQYTAILQVAGAWGEGALISGFRALCHAHQEPILFNTSVRANIMHLR